MFNNYRYIPQNRTICSLFMSMIRVKPKFEERNLNNSNYEKYLFIKC
jgi:hypothetical protein